MPITKNGIMLRKSRIRRLLFKRLNKPQFSGRSLNATSLLGKINGNPVTTATVAPPLLLDRSQIATPSSGLAFSRVTKTFDGTITLTNVDGDLRSYGESIRAGDGGRLPAWRL
jgi:hypothetical protein